MNSVIKLFLVVLIVPCFMALAGEETDASQYEAEGGLVHKPYKGKYIVVVNNQSRVAASDLFAPGNTIEEVFNFPVKIVGKSEKIEKAGVIVQVSDNSTAPSLLVAPEANWAGVNVAALATDKPSAEILKTRIQKEVMRAFLFAAGVANSEVQPCLMRPIRHARDLDKYSVMQPGPSAVAPVMNTASQLGIFELTIMTYKEACEEGWAPTPTNEVQRAIWDTVHALPTSPIAIRPEEVKVSK